MRLALALCLLSGLLTSCQNEQQNYAKLQGETMGTFYTVTCAPCHQGMKEEIDLLLIDLNLELSTYIHSSSISQFNRSRHGIPDHRDGKRLNAFIVNLEKSKAVHQQSNGAFDPSIMPLVNYWGFGTTPKRRIEEADVYKIDSMLPYVGLGLISWDQENQFIRKDSAGTQLDFSALAKGYGADLIADYLESVDVTNYLIDIGGDGRSKGLSPSQKKWTLGINYPSIDAGLTDIYAYISISDQALATSGNYRNYHKLDDGTMYSHTIDPQTGFPKKSDILSASVLAKDSMTADAWATAFMSMGLEESIKKSQSLPNIEVLFIYGEGDATLSSYISDGFKQHILDIK